MGWNGQMLMGCTGTGMGIKKGITLIVGGGYHGKSTLLSAIELGVYNHIPGDGREYCVANILTAKVRAYNGRSVVNSDISMFINKLPYGQDTQKFSTENASGSTSQAANIVEALEVGADVLLMDEDTCATNFMTRDTKMQQLVIKDDEPITTFIDKVQQLYQEKQISTILVLGGVGDYFDVADCVVQMKNFIAQDVTDAAHKIAAASLISRDIEGDDLPIRIKHRIPIAESITPYNRYGKVTINAKDVHRLNLGKEIVDLTDLEQLMELSQTKALGFAIEYAKKYMDETNSLYEVVQQVIEDIEANGLDVISEKINGHFASFRALELAFAMNRIRGFDVVQRNTQ